MSLINAFYLWCAVGLIAAYGIGSTWSHIKGKTSRIPTPYKEIIIVLCGPLVWLIQASADKHIGE